MLNPKDTEVDFVFALGQKAKIKTIKNQRGYFYGVVEYKGQPIHYTNLRKVTSGIVLSCRNWIAVNDSLK